MINFGGHIKYINPCRDCVSAEYVEGGKAIVIPCKKVKKLKENGEDCLNGLQCKYFVEVSDEKSKG